MPDFAANTNSNGQLTTSVNFRKGGCADAYVQLRQWCWQHDVNFSDIINSLIAPLNHFCHNFARLQGEDNVVVTLNFGDLTLQKVYGTHKKGKVKYRDLTPEQKKQYRQTRQTKIRLW